MKRTQEYRENSKQLLQRSSTKPSSRRAAKDGAERDDARAWRRADMPVRRLRKPKPSGPTM